MADFNLFSTVESAMVSAIQGSVNSMSGSWAATMISLIGMSIAFYTDSYGSYNALDVNDFHHHRINHSTHFTKGKNHINGIEDFWNQAKSVLRKYNGIDKNSFPVFLKECEFRFNYGTPTQQLKTLRLWCDI